ncbi:hypothetical protein F4808DRAFT_462390 [Astrocystis sublimbata]|nr:hypothetical protein F4808DRAFT_462390 [Astrocystis sublimbata]
MSGTTTASNMTGEAGTKPSHTFSHLTSNNPSLSQQRVHSYMSTKNGGGDSVTALGVRGVAPDASVSDRHADRGVQGLAVPALGHVKSLIVQLGSHALANEG